MYTISIEYNTRFRFCRVEGENNVENVTRYLNDVHHAMEERRGTQSIINIRIPANLNKASEWFVRISM